MRIAVFCMNSRVETSYRYHFIASILTLQWQKPTTFIKLSILHSLTFSHYYKHLRNCNDIIFSTIKVVATNIRLRQLRKSFSKHLAKVVPVTKKIVVKICLAKKNDIFVTNLVITKNDFSCTVVDTIVEIGSNKLLCLKLNLLCIIFFVILLSFCS